MIIFIDFDNVLLNTRSFRDEWLKAFVSCGISHEDVQESYQQALATKTAYNYDLHLALLKEKHPSLDLGLLEDRLEAVRLISHKFVFEDSIPFMERVKKYGAVELVTSGVERHQKKKIHASDLMPYFDNMHFVPPGVKKSDILLSRLSPSENGRFVFIDDMKENTDNIKAVFPAACVIQLTRFDDQECSGLADAIVTNLNDTISIIQGYGKK